MLADNRNPAGLDGATILTFSVESSFFTQTPFAQYFLDVESGVAAEPAVADPDHLLTIVGCVILGV